MNSRDVYPCPHTLPISCGMIATRRMARRNKRGEGAVVTFEEVVDQAIAMLQRRGRMTYRMLKRQFDLDDEALEDLRLELIKGQRLAGDEDGDVLVWIGDAAVAPSPAPVPPPHPSPTPRPISRRKSSPPAVRWKASANRSPCCLPTSKARWSCSPTATRRRPAQLLDPVLERMMAAVHRYEGTVNQVHGRWHHGALWGTRWRMKTTRCAPATPPCAMQAAVQPYAEEVRRTHGLALHIRVGLNAGEVVVRAIGNDLHMDYSAVGQTTHLAARMEQMATPGSDPADGRDPAAGRGLCAGQRPGALPVRGLRDPVEVFELVGASALRRRLQAAAARGLTRFVGRQPELEALQQALERAQAGHGQVVALVGEAGWASRAWSTSSSTRTARRAGWCWKAPRCPTARPRPTSRCCDLLKRYCPCRGPRRRPHRPGQSHRAGPDAGRRPPGHHPGPAGAPGRPAGRTARS